MLILITVNYTLLVVILIAVRSSVEVVPGKAIILVIIVSGLCWRLNKKEKEIKKECWMIIVCCLKNKCWDEELVLCFMLMTIPSRRGQSMHLTRLGECWGKKGWIYHAGSRTCLRETSHATVLLTFKSASVSRCWDASPSPARFKSALEMRGRYL